MREYKKGFYAGAQKLNNATGLRVGFVYNTYTQNIQLEFVIACFQVCIGYRLKDY